MYILLSLSHLTTLLLTYSVLASPTPLSRIGTRPQGINAINSGPSNTTLGLIPPQGLRDFQCTAVAISRIAIEPKYLFMTVLKLLEEITQGDFNSPLDQTTQLWHGPNNLVIVVKSVNDQPMPRRFMMWALVRILNTMKTEPRIGYHASRFEPSWRGRKVADIDVAYTRLPPGQPGSGITTKNLGTPSMSRESTNTTSTVVRSNSTSTVVGDDDIAWTYTFLEPVPGEPPMTQWDVATGSIGAMIYAAQHSNHNFDQFHGDQIDTAITVIHYRSLFQHSLLSKNIIIRSIAQAAIFALTENNFHRLSVGVLDIVHGLSQEIATGGYGPPGLVPVAARESNPVAAS
ncbi:hypothetical protein G7Y79_00018g045070 [Physcia stellaris]|nr:hypothetical protein G7Y79_00018g045070 [Physcia stellaris]